jgi:hypothetical protein
MATDLFLATPLMLRLEHCAGLGIRDVGAATRGVLEQGLVVAVDARQLERQCTLGLGSLQRDLWCEPLLQVT